MNLFHFFVLVRYTAAVLFKEKGVSEVHSLRVVYEGVVSSPLTCAHYCMQYKADVMLDGTKCKCVKKSEDGKVDDDQHAVTGTLYEEFKKPKPVTTLDCNVKIVGGKKSGAYFYFNKGTLQGLAPGTKFVFDAQNSRTGMQGQVVVWGDPKSKYGFDASGRFDNKPIAAGGGQWYIGDILIIMKKSLCTPVTVY